VIRSIAECVSAPDLTRERKSSFVEIPDSETITHSSAITPAIRSASLPAIARAQSSAIATISAATP
jgi:hypothetical protein